MGKAGKRKEMAEDRLCVRGTRAVCERAVGASCVCERVLCERVVCERVVCEIVVWHVWPKTVAPRP